jgi:hypothetical protein
MICPRHNALATHTEHGRAYCLRCFHEALRFALSEDAAKLIRRLQGKK